MSQDQVVHPRQELPGEPPNPGNNNYYEYSNDNNGNKFRYRLTISLTCL